MRLDQSSVDITTEVANVSREQVLRVIDSRSLLDFPKVDHHIAEAEE